MILMRLSVLILFMRLSFVRCVYILRQFARGYLIDKNRMENATFIGEDYFEHLLVEICEIRLAERCFYHELTDISRTSSAVTMP